MQELAGIESRSNRLRDIRVLISASALCSSVAHALDCNRCSTISCRLRGRDATLAGARDVPWLDPAETAEEIAELAAIGDVALRFPHA